jgi:hypothetical protein
MRYELVNIKRDTQTTTCREVPEWEIPVLEFIFADVNIERTGAFVNVNRPTPTAASEFDRLSRAYGADVKSGVPHVAAVYGNGSLGVRAMSKVMEESKAAEAAANPKSRARRTAQPDSLLA